jgi:hypothetical protein
MVARILGTPPSHGHGALAVAQRRGPRALADGRITRTLILRRFNRALGPASAAAWRRPGQSRQHRGRPLRVTKNGARALSGSGPDRDFQVRTDQLPHSHVPLLCKFLPSSSHASAILTAARVVNGPGEHRREQFQGLGTMLHAPGAAQLPVSSMVSGHALHLVPVVQCHPTVRVRAEFEHLTIPRTRRSGALSEACSLAQAEVLTVYFANSQLT